MHIFRWNGSGGFVSSGGAATEVPDESHFTRTQATVSDGVATIHRLIFFEADAPTEDATDVLAVPGFPTKYSAHPHNAAYKYYGNAEIKPTSENGWKYWVADLEYSTSDPNATDDDGNPVTSDTKPWKLRPENIQFTYPEIIKPFEASYDSGGQMYDSNGGVILPVKNSAGDKIALERSVRNLQLSFTFAAENWDVSNTLAYGNTINNEEITVCGLTIPAHKGLLLPPECSYITVYEDGSARIKWQYWSININIQIDYTGDLLYRKVLDVGNRAKFGSISLAHDEMLQAAITAGASLNTTLPATTDASQICHFRLQKKMNNSGENMIFWPVMENTAGGAGLIFCSWEQFIAARYLYYEASHILSSGGKITSIYDLQCEQDNQMPLSGGFLYTQAIEGHANYVSGTKYRTRTFREYPETAWSSLHLPTKGIGQWVISSGGIVG